MDNSFFYLLAVLCLVILSVSMLRRSHQRRATSRDLTREQFARLRDQRGVQQSMEELLLQLEEVSRRVSAQVDTRFTKLEMVIRDADQRIARLEQLRGAAPVAASSTKLGAQQVAPFKPSSAHEPALPTAATPAQASPPAPPTNPTDRRQRVFELADAGSSAITIADLLQMPLGEVELLLNLRRFK